MYKAVVFDMDGVIFDSEKLILDIWVELGEEHNIPDVEVTMHKCLGVNATETKQIFLRDYGEDFPYDVYVKEASRRFHAKADNGELPMKPGVCELLCFLKEKGYIIGLASSTREASVRQELKDAGIIDYFDELVCGDMLKKSKPEPDIYLMACDKLGVTPQEAVAIEDSFNGIRSAYAAGMIPIMVPDIAQPDEEMKEKSFRIFANLLEVKEWLEKIGE
ncbi:MAG: HAD family phosphatase [Lachnospiraceae bacterium]|nr:HAD family phosphatase [Lachnospiraceae bacterium]